MKFFRGITLLIPLITSLIFILYPLLADENKINLDVWSSLWLWGILMLFATIIFAIFFRKIIYDLEENLFPFIKQKNMTEEKKEHSISMSNKSKYVFLLLILLGFRIFEFIPGFLMGLLNQSLEDAKNTAFILSNISRIGIIILTIWYGFKTELNRILVIVLGLSTFLPLMTWISIIILLTRKELPQEPLLQRNFKEFIKKNKKYLIIGLGVIIILFLFLYPLWEEKIAYWRYNRCISKVNKELNKTSWFIKPALAVFTEPTPEEKLISEKCYPIIKEIKQRNYIFDLR